MINVDVKNNADKICSECGEHCLSAWEYDNK